MKHDQILMKIDNEAKALEPSQYITVFLEAGHHAPGQIAQHSINSFKHAVTLAKHLKYEYRRRVKVVLGVLIDDLGLNCNSERCSISEKPNDRALPPELNSILYELNFNNQYPIILSSEINLKNRAISFLKREMERLRKFKPFVFEDDLGETKMYFDLPQGIAFLGTIVGHKVTIRCPLLMSYHYLNVSSQLEKAFPYTNKILLCDWSLFSEQQKVIEGHAIFRKIADSGIFNLKKPEGIELFNIFSDSALVTSVVRSLNGSTLTNANKFPGTINEPETTYLFGL